MTQVVTQGDPTPAEQRLFDRRFAWLLFGSLACLLGTLLLLHVVSWLAGRSPLWSVPGLIPRGWQSLAALVAAGCSLATAGAAWRAARTGRVAAARAAVLVTVLLGAAFLALRYGQWQAASRAGLGWWNSQRFLFEAPDLQYLHAVRVELRHRARELDAEVSGQPARLAAESRRRLALADRLREEMVTWTEEQVARWQSDLRRRQGAIALLAYQVQPAAFLQAAAEASFRGEQRELPQWEDSLDRVLGLWQPEPSTGISEPAGSTAGEPASAIDRAAATRLLGRLRAGTGEPLWQWLQFVLLPPEDAAAASSPRSAVERRLEQIRRRRAFVDTFVEPVFQSPPAIGLNTAEPWLKLPRCVPGGARWVRSWLAINAVLGAMVVLGLGLLLWSLLARWEPAGDARWSAVLMIWLNTAGWSLLSLLLCGA